MASSWASVWSLAWRMKWVLLVVLAMRGYLLGTALLQQSYLTDDSIQYLTIAENLRNHSAYSQSYAPPLAPDCQRTPGYPIFVWLLGGRPWLILVVQHLLALLSGGLVFAILRLRFDATWAGRGMGLYLLQPYGAVFASYVLSETLFICLLLAWLWAYLRHWSTRDWRWLALSMFLLVLATYVRPVTLILLPIIALVSIVQAVRTRQSWVASLTAAALLPIAMLAPWYARVHQHAGTYAMTSMGPMGMLHGRLGGLEAWRQGLGADEDDLYMLGDSVAAQQLGLAGLRSFPDNKQTHETELLTEQASGITLRFYLQHPIDAIGFQVHAFWEMFKGVGYGWAKELTHNKIAAAILAGMQLVLNLLSYLGLLLAVVRMRKWTVQEGITFATLAITLLVSAAAWADGRYRAVVDPLMVILLIFVLTNFESREAEVGRTF